MNNRQWATRAINHLIRTQKEQTRQLKDLQDAVEKNAAVVARLEAQLAALSQKGK
jgi:hypothetical protein